MFKNARFVAGIALALILGVLCGWWLASRGAEEGETTKNSYDAAPDFTLQDYEGNEVTLTSFSGMVRIVNLWASWCPFCVDELSEFARIAEHYEGLVEVFAVNRAEPPSIARAFSDAIEGSEHIHFVLDPEDSYFAQIGGFAMPETLFIDREGNIRLHKRGPMQFEEIEAALKPLLQ